jgi:hypothetical protein
MVYPLGQIPGEAPISTFHPEGKQLDDEVNLANMENSLLRDQDRG